MQYMLTVLLLLCRTCQQSYCYYAGHVNSHAFLMQDKLTVILFDLYTIHVGSHAALIQHMLAVMLLFRDT